MVGGAEWQVGRPCGWSRAREGDADEFRKGGQETRWCTLKSKGKNRYFLKNKGNDLFSTFSEEENIFRSHYFYAIIKQEENV